MPISEFGFLMLMFILLNHYMFVEVMRFLQDNKWKLIKCILRPIAKFTHKAKQAFFITLCYISLFFMRYLTLLPMARPLTSGFTNGFSMKTSLINNFCL